MQTSIYKHASIIVYLGLTLSSCSKSLKHEPPEPATVIHHAQLPEGWYSHNPYQLNKELDGYLEQAQHYFPVPPQGDDVKALIVPHAGYHYSGLAASTAYQALLENKYNTPLALRKNKTIKRVIILAPSHTTFYNGIALPEYTVFQTVLGAIPVDWKTVQKINNNACFRKYQLAHLKEHSVEMQLPFLQKTVEQFSIVPLVVGHMTPEDTFNAAKILSTCIDDTTLIVVSSDFVHHGKDYDFKPFNIDIIDHVRLLDSYAMQAIAHQSFSTFDQVLRNTNASICGREPIKILLALLEMHTLKNVQAQLSCYYTSAHLAHAEHNNVSYDVKKLLDAVPDNQAQNSVSYLAVVMGKPTQGLTGFEKQSLLKLARTTLENAYKNEREKKPEPLLFPVASTKLLQPTGAFVTLKTRDGKLRGCMGRIVSTDPLSSTVHDMSLASAFHDTRFAPLTKDELENISIEISILTPPVAIQDYNEIQLGRHGIILNKHDSTGNLSTSSVFLPQVPTEFGWNLATTLEQLSLKAGLGVDAYKQGCSFEVFESITLKE